MKNCKNCYYQEVSPIYGRICQHKPSMEGTEAEEEFISCMGMEYCDYYIPYKEVETTYRITKITDREGKDRTDGRYPLRIGRLCTKPYIKIGFPMWMLYLENADGSDYSGKVYATSPIVEETEIEDSLTVTTKNSIYYFKKEKPEKK